MVPSWGCAPSATQITANFLPRENRSSISLTRSAGSKGRSGRQMPWAPPAMPDSRAIQPAWRPMTSTTITRWWESAVVFRRSMASVATPTAVSKPKVRSVEEMSLSIVFGTPTTGTPASDSMRAAVSVPSPPMGMSASKPLRSMRSLALSQAARNRPRSRRDEPRIVPPRARMPLTAFRSRAR
ncbi:hypothetical protein SALBM135S_03511 [Streptomyces alboniger]